MRHGSMSAATRMLRGERRHSRCCWFALLRTDQLCGGMQGHITQALLSHAYHMRILYEEPQAQPITRNNAPMWLKCQPHLLAWSQSFP